MHSAFINYYLSIFSLIKYQQTLRRINDNIDLAYLYYCAQARTNVWVFSRCLFQCWWHACGLSFLNVWNSFQIENGAGSSFYLAWLKISYSFCHSNWYTDRKHCRNLQLTRGNVWVKCFIKRERHFIRLTLYFFPKMFVSRFVFQNRASLYILFCLKGSLYQRQSLVHLVPFCVRNLKVCGWKICYADL